MPYPSKKALYFAQILERYESGVSVAEACEDLPVTYGHVCRWFKEEGIPIRKAGRHRRERTVHHITCRQCGSAFDTSRKDAVFCSRDCTNQWQRENKTRLPDRECVGCGASFHPNNVNQIYCTHPCARRHQRVRQKDPANHITFTCQNPNCGKEVTRPRSAPGHKFCSNECAAKITKAVHHVIDMETSTVLDSGWEALFWGLCKFLKVPIERVDRALAIEWAPGQYYAPDFIMGGTYVEIKGLEDDEDQEKWHAWNSYGHGRLLILDQKLLEQFRRMSRYELLCYAGLPEDV